MLYILESLKNNDREILAVSSDIHEFERCREKIAATTEAYLTVTTLAYDFPLYVIEHRELNREVPMTLFRFTPAGGLLALLESTPNLDNDSEAAFRYYLFDSAYFRDSGETSWIQPVPVDDVFLSGFRENESENYLRRQHLAAIVHNYNIDALDFLYEYWVHQNEEQHRIELAEDGYAALFWTMSYDLACSKLHPDGLSYFIPMIEKAEALTLKSLWMLRAEAFTNLAYNAIEHEPGKVGFYHLQAVDALMNQIREGGATAELYQRLAYTYGELLTHDQINQYSHWQKSIESMREGIRIDAENIRWEYYVKLVFGEILNEDITLKELRIQATQRFHNDLASFAENDAYHQVIVALAYRNYIRECEQEQRDVSPVIHVQALYWLDLAISWKGGYTSSVTTTQVADFFREEGIRLQRMDILDAALALYFPAGESVSGDTYRVARILQDVAALYFAQNNLAAANDYLHQTWQYYRERWQDNDDNFSYLIQYGEFLEKLYNAPFVVDKPEIRDMRYVATCAEQAGNGYYASPGFLLARLALLEGDEEEAIHLVTRELLLHELCIDNRIRDFSMDEQFKAFRQFQIFLEKTLQFMDEVSDGYYFDPSIPWSELNAMTRQEVFTAWQRRMQVIRNRKKLS